ncbi:protein prenyltransferase alpha subunit repeat-containing protein 1 [Meleagris gallopavo]|uniref:protein prenyltransferase alpha subunit repeat-containing protein 1 n=1 Tax=Meleagris gallopavo TaxID=9103 RepID=UPI0012AC470A|nr:protein prenyltransferase alpha subunit repeat-containing protein 1 [Meleagris gallopavo]
MIHDEIVLDLLQKLDAYKSMGPDGLRPRVLRDLADAIAKPLSIILRQSWLTGDISVDWKLANVTPIFKKGRKDNPESHSVWDSWFVFRLCSLFKKNYFIFCRKELILSGTLSPLKDLHLGKLALTKFPKSPETWIHRRWVLQQLIQENSLPAVVNKGNLGVAPAERIHRLVQEEMDVCSEAAGRYPSNYNAWSHRIWVLQNVGKLTTKVLLDELSSTKYWVSMHVSDHSGFHYRQFLLKSLIGRTVNDNNTLVQNQMGNEQNSSLQTEEECEGAEAVCVEEQSVDISHYLEEELDFCTDLIDTYPGHETLWCHRRCVFYLQHHLINKLPLLSVAASSVDSSDETLYNSHPNPTTSHMAQVMDVDGLNESSSKQGYTQETKRLKRAPMQDSFGPEMEYRFIDKVLSTCRDVDQARFATAYRKWLVTFLGQ